jgi:hypothetical protein
MVETVNSSVLWDATVCGRVEVICCLTVHNIKRVSGSSETTVHFYEHAQLNITEDSIFHKIGEFLDIMSNFTLRMPRTFDLIKTRIVHG